MQLAHTIFSSDLISDATIAARLGEVEATLFTASKQLSTNEKLSWIKTSHRQIC